jgi:hypothetical protein
MSLVLSYYHNKSVDLGRIKFEMQDVDCVKPPTPHAKSYVRHCTSPAWCIETCVGLILRHVVQEIYEKRASER